MCDWDHVSVAVLIIHSWSPLSTVLVKKKLFFSSAFGRLFRTSKEDFWKEKLVKRRTSEAKKTCALQKTERRHDTVCLAKRNQCHKRRTSREGKKTCAVQKTESLNGSVLRKETNATREGLLKRERRLDETNAKCLAQHRCSPLWHIGVNATNRVRGTSLTYWR